MRAVKASYSAIVNALNNIYEQTHEPEALGIRRALYKPSTVLVMYLLNYVLPQVAKLSRAFQEESIDLTAITPLVDSTLNTLDNVTLPAANWVLELMDAKDEIEITTERGISLQRTRGTWISKPFKNWENAEGEHIKPICFTRHCLLI